MTEFQTGTWHKGSNFDKIVEYQILFYFRDQPVLGCPPSSSQFRGLQPDNSTQAVGYAIFLLMGKTFLLSFIFFYLNFKFMGKTFLISFFPLNEMIESLNCVCFELQLETGSGLFNLFMLRNLLLKLYLKVPRSTTNIFFSKCY